MSRGRGLSRYSIYRLRLKRTRETAARIQYFRQRQLDIQQRRSSYPEIITNASTSTVPPMQEVEQSPLLNSTAISPVAGPSSATTIKYPAMRPNYISDDIPGVLNLTMLEENVNSQPAISHPKGYEAAIFSAIMELKEDFKSFKNEIRSELKELSARIENTNLYVATLDSQVNKYHCDVVGKTCNASPTKPRWRP
ncbi:unnamed protein product [Calicophoron daubneyi]|uniref:Uncharacterized protein n=1 Tax=Calicophoron daubneyi TaxID=300641 RepID=A0AAV2T5E4_CALDB